jgi:WD40 repeat protein/tRNA A-37 threonylcarbamoyl transferase component Bud32
MLKTCPSPDQLRQFLDEEMSQAQEASIGEHVEACPFCQESLELLTTSVGLAGRQGTAEGGAPGPVTPDAAFLQSLKSLPPANLLSGGGPVVDDPSATRQALPNHRPDWQAPDEYEFLEELGRGGMGVVCKVRQRRLNRPVALKMLLAGHETPRDHDRFRREAEAIALLHHPNIVQIYEIGEYHGRPYLALEFIDGENLARHLGGVPLSARRSAELVEQLARAIDAAHRIGIIHRDLKPSNVLLTEAGVPKITDFGLAKRLDGAVAFPTLTEQFLGTPSYMAPEQAMRKRSASAHLGDDPEIPPAVDIYSLGAILYEMLTGRPPFRAETPLETVLQVLHEEPVPPSKLQPKVPRDLESICLNCLEKSPHRRYHSALDLAEDLDRFLNFEPVKVRPVAAPERLWRWCRRKTSLAFAVGLAAVALAAAVGSSTSLAVYYYRASARIGEALHEVQERRRQVDQQAAHLAYEQGQTLCEQGDVAQGILWLVRGLKNAAVARDPDLERAFRLNVSGWKPRLHSLRVRCEFPGEVHAVAYSPDGRTIAIAGDDNTLRLRDAATGEPVGEPFPHSAKVGAVAFSPDGRTLLTGCDDNIARLWDVATGRQTGPEFPHANAILGVGFSPDGTIVLTGSVDHTARLWSAADGRPIGPPMVHDELITSAAFSPDGRTVLTGSWDRTARLWNAATAAPIGSPLVHTDWVSSVAYSPDSRIVLTGCYDRTARLWDRETCRPIGVPLRHQHCVRAVAFSPGGQTVLTGSFDGTARLWDIKTANPIGPPLRHQHTVSSVAFSPDGRTILTAGFDKTAVIWDVARTSGLSFEHQGFIRAVLFSPDGRTILSASQDHTARLWNAATAEPIGTPLVHGDSVESIAFSPDGRTVLTGSNDRSARLWDAATGAPLGPPLLHEDRVKTVAFSPGGKTVLTGSSDHTARLWDAGAGTPLVPPLRHDGWVLSVAYSPDGRLIATGSDDKTARLWDSARGTPVGEPLLHGGKVMAVAFSPDGRTLLTGSDDMKARLWDVRSRSLRVPPLQHDGPVSVAAFSADGVTVITGGWDRVARLWNARTGLSMTPPLRHEGLLRALAFSPDGQTVLTGSYDRRAQLWDESTGKPIGPAFRHENQVWFVTFSPDGRTVLSGGQENAAYLWSVPTVMNASIEQIERALQIATGMVLLDDGSLHILDSAELNERRVRTD